MARIAGRNGRLYANITSGGTAESIAFLNKWSLNFASDKIEVTAFGDTTKTYVAGLPDCQGDYTGFYDNATAQFYTAATDGVARKFYLYPDNTLTSQYWFGTAFFDVSVEAEVSGAVSISGSLAAATAVAKVG
jgi:hypothetical protein